jgi:hypothetical protein
MKALERDPAARWSTCVDFGDALEKAARAANTLASNRDVAQHILAVIGTDISQQRDALRAWLTRSEPSRQANFTIPSSAPSAKLPETSSVSSAVLAIPPGVATTQPAPAPAKKSRLWMVAAAAVVLLAVGIPIALSKMKTEPVAATSPPSSTAAIAAIPTPSPSPSPTTPPTADSIPVVAASALTVTRPPAGKPPGTAHVKPGGKGTATATTTTATTTASPTSTKSTLPDENPYR